MAAIEAEMLGKMGRLHFEVKAIVGFSRITTGDVFEISIKHGSQRWKTRGKTQSDKSQKWDQTTATLDCSGDVPVVIKVTEVKFFKSRCLNERSFDPMKFFSHQPQLVTMNLNNIGSLKLQLIVTWLPLLTSKGVGMNGSGRGIQSSATQLVRIQSKVGDVRNSSLPRSKSLGLDTQNRLNGFSPFTQANGINASPMATPTTIQAEEEMDNNSPPKICLREKKRDRERQLSMSASTNDKEKSWRSSTTILDSVYKDLSKSILTIDDLSVLSSSRTNLHKPNASESQVGSDRRLKRNSSSGKEENSFSIKSLQSAGERAASVSQLNNGTTLPENGVQQKSGVRKTKLSSLKKSRNTQSAANNNCVEKPPPPQSEMWRSFADHRPNSFSHRQSHPDLHSNPNPASLNPSTLNGQRWLKKSEPMKRVDGMLELIDTLRGLLGNVRAAEYSELVGFEACMLNWEAILKLNRASFLDENRMLIRRTGSGIRALPKRSSLYVQHSPSTASDELDDNVILNGTDSQVSENDSGIDSLRQHISPYNTQNSQSSSSMNPYGQLHSTIGNNNGTSGGMAAQRRFKQFKERRKSLGIVLDAALPTVEYERLVLSNLPEPPNHRLENGGQKMERRQGSSVSSSTQSSNEIGTRNGTVMSNVSATGNAEIDECLKHHLDRAISSLKSIDKGQNTPFEFTLTEMLCRMEQDTIALETLLGIVDCLPSLPNVYHLLSELGAGDEVQEMWFSACFQLKAFVIVPTEVVRQRIHVFLMPIVEARYPKLVQNVQESVMFLLCQSWNLSQVSVFQFVSLFRGKHLTSFIENLSHEAWITSNLMSSHPNAVKEVMNRLRNVPVVPPLESLRHIALVLAKDPPQVTSFVEKYLRTTSNELANDLSACFMCLLEHEDELSRCGACRALAHLRQENALKHLDYLSGHDKSAQVQSEARKAFKEIRRYYSTYQEITKI